MDLNTGGPLICEKDGRVVLAGVTSWGIGKTKRTDTESSNQKVLKRYCKFFRLCPRDQSRRMGQGIKLYSMVATTYFSRLYYFVHTRARSKKYKLYYVACLGWGLRKPFYGFWLAAAQRYFSHIWRNLINGRFYSKDSVSKNEFFDRQKPKCRLQPHKQPQKSLKNQQQCLKFKTRSKWGGTVDHKMRMIKTLIISRWSMLESKRSQRPISGCKLTRSVCWNKRKMNGDRKTVFSNLASRATFYR